MKNDLFLKYRKHYLPPLVTVYKCEMINTLLMASNEGLDYEDLFTPQLNSFDEEPSQFLP